MQKVTHEPEPQHALSDTFVPNTLQWHAYFNMSGPIWKESPVCCSHGGVKDHSWIWYCMSSRVNVNPCYVCSLQPLEGINVGWMHRKPPTYPQLYSKFRFIYLGLTFLKRMHLWIQTLKVSLMIKKMGGGNTLTQTHACIANWNTDELSLETLQPSFSCRASNSQRRDREPLAEQNRKRSETAKDRAEQVIFWLPCSSSHLFYLLEVRQTKNRTCECLHSWQIKNDISEKKLTSSIFLLRKYLFLLTLCTAFFFFFAVS